MTRVHKLFLIHIQQVSAHDAYRILRPKLLELLARSPSIAGQVVNGANGDGAIASRLVGKMGAPLPGWLEDHGLLIIRIDTAICLNRRRIDDENVQMEAALAAAQAEHGRIARWERLY